MHSPELSQEAWDLLEPRPEDGELLRWFRVRLDRHRALQVDEDIRWLLSHSTDVDRTVEAFEGAVRRGLHAEVEAGLAHRFSRVVARAPHCPRHTAPGTITDAVTPL